MRGIQKLSNRLTTGLIIAALIVGAAMLMRIDTKWNSSASRASRLSAS